MAIGLYDPHSTIRIKLLAFQERIELNPSFFLQKIQTAYQKRLPLLSTTTNSYRLIYGENDGLPSLIADVYDNVLVLKLYSAIWYPYLEDIIESLKEVSCCTTMVLRLSRNLQQLAICDFELKDGQVILGELADEAIVFQEYGIRFSTNVIKGHKTGFFLDHRHNRKRIGELAKGKTVLDLFSYAGGFSVHALVGGAKAVTSLDISGGALQMAQANVALNLKNANHSILKMDVFEGLTQLQQEGQLFDIIIVDPPSFAKSQQERERAISTYQRLFQMTIPLVRRNGILLLASCSSRIKADEFYDLTQQSLAASGRKYKELERNQHDIDHPISFPEGAYLKSIYYRLD